MKIQLHHIGGFRHERWILCLTAMAMTWAWASSLYAADLKQGERPNVLFIAIDDLNDWVGCLDKTHNPKTPNIDRLASRGTLFTNATCAAPICNPSRAAIMSGLLPSTSGIYGNNRDGIRENPAGIEFQSLPQYFKNHGYTTLRTGKIIHHGGPTDPISWTDAFPSLEVHKPKENGPPNFTGNSFKWEMVGLDIPDSEMDDGMVADWAIKQLGRKHTKPFFLAVGMYKPHLPWIVPQKYFDMHPLEDIVLPKINQDDFDDIPEAGYKLHMPHGGRQYPTYFPDEETSKRRVQAYLAAGSFADAQVGRVLDALAESPYADNTIIVLWSDHGWHLGEKLHITKFTLWEEAARVPFIFSGGPVAKGARCDTPVSLINIYPTLVSLCGLPANPQNDGKDLTPQLLDHDAKCETPSLLTYLPNNHALRTERWRYIRYADGSEELYNHDKDPMEWINLANDPEYAKLKLELSRHFPAMVEVNSDKKR